MSNIFSYDKYPMFKRDDQNRVTLEQALKAQERALAEVGISFDRLFYPSGPSHPDDRRHEEHIRLHAEMVGRQSPPPRQEEWEARAEAAEQNVARLKTINEQQAAAIRAHRTERDDFEARLTGANLLLDDMRGTDFLCPGQLSAMQRMETDLGKVERAIGSIRFKEIVEGKV